MTLYSKFREQMGNTALRRDVVRKLTVLSKDDRGCEVKSEYGRPHRLARRQVERLYRNPPKVKESFFKRWERVIKGGDA